jgi:O-acetyl-ADP-ribose deacetylase (regulator of RNase III)
MKTIKGNLITLAEQGEFDVIIHGCNCFHAMGGGIAKQLADRYPEVAMVDKQTQCGDRNKLGTSTSVLVEVNTTVNDNVFTNVFTVVNAYTQHMWSSGSDVFEYDAFGKFLSTVANVLVEDDKKSKFASTDDKGGTMRILPIKKRRIGFPQIGAGLAGGDWNRISKMIEKFSEEVACYADVTVVEYQP